MMSKIALVKYRFLGKQGGLERQAFKIIDELINRGHDVTLISSQTINYQSIHSVRLKTYAPKGFINLFVFNRRVSKYLEKNSFDQILSLDRTCFHTHIRAGNGVHQAYLKLRKEKVGFLKRLSFILNPLHTTLLYLEKKGFLAKSLKTIFVNSELVKNQILSFYKLPKELIQVIHNGIDWELKKNSFTIWKETKEEWIKKLKLNPDFKTCVFIGHDFERKGLKHILDALFYSQNIQLLVIGQDKNLNKFKKLAKSLNLLDRVHFLDCFTDVTPFYALADALILPTLYDPFANVTLEALSMGVPVYTSSTNGASEVIAPFAGKSFDITIATPSLISILQNLEKKTDEKAQKIRESVKHLDYSSQLTCLIDSLCKS
jgi:UDP-glucose:(heptosyl)LPS alpha-1,3-glucosyltransferase